MNSRARPGRNRARRSAMQAVYQALMTDQPLTEIASQFRELQYLDGADEDYFDSLLREITRQREQLEQLIAAHADRPLTQIDPVEHATLLVAVAELAVRLDVPYRVVIDEAIGLCRRYGSSDGHKYVNAIVDRVARELREAEYGRRGR